jgi:hypothetical protein
MTEFDCSYHCNLKYIRVHLELEAFYSTSIFITVFTEAANRPHPYLAVAPYRPIAKIHLGA